MENRAPVVHSFRWSSSRQSSFHSFLPIKCWTFNYIFFSNYAQLFLLSSVVTLKDANRALVFGGAVQDSPSILVREDASCWFGHDEHQKQQPVVPGGWAKAEVPNK
ncbi:unnamed protein product [Musa acuminata subsp. malaccensis]|uniref:(wild Malaysian banana) hypothetical protein n=1 Tax=Musa acuminata subsp. malaccensis TaxID=214687 RepID=A0A804L840_MUSAM|nr:unnamed protein product [Musa acuminata subsp. malaccensis]